MDYFVPNFGPQDHDITTTWNSLDVAEQMRGHKWHLSEDWKKKPEPPTEYNFDPELDEDIVDTNDHMAAAEKSIGKKWTYNAVQIEGENKLYTDEELAELTRQHNESLAQVNTESDPVCHPAGCTQYLFPKDTAPSHPMNYPVPNFGIDQPDVATTFNSLDVAESMYQHRWVLTHPWNKDAAPPTKYDGNAELDDDIKDT